MEHPVLIIGAGVSGLALAQGLLKHNIPFRIFERDSSLQARTQGYRVRIADEGIAALKQNLPPERFEKLKRCCAYLTSATGNMPACHLDALTGEAADELFGKGAQRPTVTSGKPLMADRSVLRAVLSEDLEPYLEFGKEYEGHEESEDGVSVRFKDGSTATGSVLVGADGAWSKIRQRLLPEYHLLDTGGRLVYGKTVMTAEFESHFCSEALHCGGLTLLRDLDAGRMCLIEPMRFDQNEKEVPDDYVYWVFFLRKERDMPEGDDAVQLSTSETQKFIREMTSKWHPSICLLFDTPQMTLSRVLSSESSVPSWPADARVTFVGDSIHLMPPTAAFGATTALRDTGVLVDQLAQNHEAGDVQSHLRAYEAEMRIYAAQVINQSALGGKAVFGMKPWAELQKVGMASDLRSENGFRSS